MPPHMHHGRRRACAQGHQTILRLDLAVHPMTNVLLNRHTICDTLNNKRRKHDSKGKRMTLHRLLGLFALVSVLGVSGGRVTTATTPPEMAGGAASAPIIIDHTCTDLSQIPDYWIEQAKALTLHYAHTSHGSQINSGILALEQRDSDYSVAIQTSSSSAGLPTQNGRPPRI